MWMLWFVPDSILYFVVIGIIFSGISIYAISYITRVLPPLIPYTGIIRIAGTLLTVLGIYFFGSYSTEMDWRTKVAQMEAKVAESEAKSAKTNTVIQKVYVDKIKVVKDVQIVIKDRIIEKEKIIDAECKIAPEAIDILNDAATGGKK